MPLYFFHWACIFLYWLSPARWLNNILIRKDRAVQTLLWLMRRILTRNRHEWLLGNIFGERGWSACSEAVYWLNLFDLCCLKFYSLIDIFNSFFNHVGASGCSCFCVWVYILSAVFFWGLYLFIILNWLFFLCLR